MMKRSLTDIYPWHRLKAGESFFVPALDIRTIEREGRQMAVHMLGTSNVRATPCIYKGLLGVMFRRVR